MFSITLTLKRNSKYNGKTNIISQSSRNREIEKYGPTKINKINTILKKAQKAKD